MSSKLEVKVEIRCPVCSKKGEIWVEKNFILESKRGVSAINVSQDLVCEHSFVAYIDKNLDVRDCFICDFKVQIPEIGFKEVKIDEEIDKDLDLDIIKLNIVPSLMINIISGIIFKKNIVLLSDQEFLNVYFKKFFRYIIADTFKTELVIIKRADYKNDKKKYKDYIVFEGTKIIQDKTKFIKNRKLKIESTIAQKFYSEIDPYTSLIIIKNEVQKVYKLAEQIIEFNDSLEENQDFTTKKIFDHFFSIYQVKMPNDYLQFIIEIAETYFNAELKRPSTIADYFGFM